MERNSPRNETVKPFRCSTLIRNEIEKSAMAETTR